MTRTIFTTFFLFLLISSCDRCKTDDTPTIKVCLNIQHHEERIPNTKVYVQYNDSVFPGYESTEGFDAEFQVGEDGRGCLENLPLGIHWLVAHGWDENWGDGAPVRGSMRIQLTPTHYQIDSIIYVQEY